MTRPTRPPTPLGDMRGWAERLIRWLIDNKDKLTQRTSLINPNPSQDGVLLWCAINKNPVISLDNEWMPLHISAGAYGMFYDTTAQAPSAINTAYAINWGNAAYSNHISIDGTDSSKIVFEYKGTYKIEFSAEMHSESASAKTGYFWPRINGTDVAGSTMINTLETNDHKMNVSRAGIFQVNAGDYLQAMFAVDDLNLDIHGEAATAFCPATPSATMVITEVTYKHD